MQYNLFFKILLILTVIFTVAICNIKPKMHESMLIYDSAYKIVESDVKPLAENIPTISQKPVVKKVVKSKPQEIVKKSVNKVTPQPVLKKTAETPKVVQKVKVEPKVIKQQKMTEAEEEIAWNKWRSNLQNSIMKDIEMPIVPAGTTFKFTFTVDKYGRISNVQTWSYNSAYTPYAIQYIAPVIRGYQGRSVLNFPNGTSRVITEVTGGFKTSSNTRYSTPNDYNDIEKVKR